jgi:uracil-DNA glycosylase
MQVDLHTTRSIDLANFRNKVYRRWPLKFWKTGEWQTIKEKLHECRDDHTFRDLYCPGRFNLFRELSLLRPEQVKVVIVGQDPYPDPVLACGIAFSIPGYINAFPGSLVNIFKEYSDDLDFDTPKSGDLTGWLREGVLLWNAFPTCAIGRPGSHHWCEYEAITKEILGTVDGQKPVFIFLGRVAQAYQGECSERQRCISTSHPSPLGAHKGFLGSRIFSRANDILINIGKEPINWRL